MHASALRYLDYVARVGSIRGAAQVMNVASTAVNRRILKLERQLGSPIFERRRDGVVLTAAGKLLLQHVRSTLTDYKRTISEITALTGDVEGEVKLITIRPMIDKFLPEAMADLAKRFPKISFRITGFDPSETGEKVDIASYDLAIIFTEDGTLGHTVIARVLTTVGLIVPPLHQLTRRRRVTFADCADFQILTLDDLWFQRAVSETQFTKRGGRLNLRLVANSLPMLQSAIKNGLGIGVFSPIAFMDELSEGSLSYVPLNEPSFGKTEISLVAPHHQQLSIPAKLFGDVLMQRFSTLQREITKVTKAASVKGSSTLRDRRRTRRRGRVGPAI